VKTAWKLFA